MKTSSHVHIKTESSRYMERLKISEAMSRELQKLSQKMPIRRYFLTKY